jgi:hypothetical protein
MATKYTKIFHFNALQNVPKFGLLVSKFTIWQPWWHRAEEKIGVIFSGFLSIWSLNGTANYSAAWFLCRERTICHYYIQLDCCVANFKWMNQNEVFFFVRKQHTSSSGVLFLFYFSAEKKLFSSKMEYWDVILY